MTNNSNAKPLADQIARDVQRLRSALEFIQGRSSSEHNGMITHHCATAEEHIQEILDHVDGEAVTTFDTMLDEVRKARQAYFTPSSIEGTALEHAVAAHRLVAPALMAVYGK